METGEYFLSKEQKAQRDLEQRKAQQEDNSAKKQAERLKSYIAPAEKTSAGTGEPTQLDLAAMKERLKVRRMRPLSWKRMSLVFRLTTLTLSHNKFCLEIDGGKGSGERGEDRGLRDWRKAEARGGGICERGFQGLEEEQKGLGGGWREAKEEEVSCIHSQPFDSLARPSDSFSVHPMRLCHLLHSLSLPENRLPNRCSHHQLLYTTRKNSKKFSYRSISPPSVSAWLLQVERPLFLPGPAHSEACVFAARGWGDRHAGRSY
jgi:hypothetical protein